MIDLIKSFAKQIIKPLIYRPSFVAMGQESVFRFPWSLANRRQIVVGARTRIGPFATIKPISNYRGKSLEGHVSIGSNVYIGGRLWLFSAYSVTIGDDCVLSEDVYITDNGHGLDPRAGNIMDQPLTSKGPVALGRGVFVGYGCSILDGVTLGDHSVVGSRSVVTRSFPAYSMVVGSPARLIKRFSFESGRWEPVVDLPAAVEQCDS